MPKKVKRTFLNDNYEYLEESSNEPKIKGLIYPRSNESPALFLNKVLKS